MFFKKVVKYALLKCKEVVLNFVFQLMLNVSMFTPFYGLLSSVNHISININLVKSAILRKFYIVFVQTMNEYCETSINIY